MGTKGVQLGASPGCFLAPGSTHRPPRVNSGSTRGGTGLAFLAAEGQILPKRSFKFGFSCKAGDPSASPGAGRRIFLKSLCFFTAICSPDPGPTPSPTRGFKKARIKPLCGRYEVRATCVFSLGDSFFCIDFARWAVEVIPRGSPFPTSFLPQVPPLDAPAQFPAGANKKQRAVIGLFFENRIPHPCESFLYHVSQIPQLSKIFPLNKRPKTINCPGWLWWCLWDGWIRLAEVFHHTIAPLPIDRCSGQVSN